MTDPDPRLHAYRPDLAATGLEGRVSAQRFAEGKTAAIAVPVVALRRTPASTGARETELLYGEEVTVYDQQDGWAWVQSAADSYVGYVGAGALAPVMGGATHRISAARTFVYAEPDIKSPVLHWLSLNSPVRGEALSNGYFALAGGGYAVTGHLRAAGDAADDFVAAAEALIETPYLWGGRSSLGLDCSGLVQCALHAAGFECPRDTDMQEAALGRAVSMDEEPLRGDLVFWKGHVGMLTDGETLLHANAFHMKTVKEPAREAIARIAGAAGSITSVRRMPALSAR